MATTVKYEASDWSSEAFRREALKEARKEARQARKRVIIKVGDTKMGYRTVATVDGRFYVGKITTLAILFLTACSGEAFRDGGFKSDISYQEKDSGITLIDSTDAGHMANVDASTPKDSGWHDSVVSDTGTQVLGTGGRDSGISVDSGNGGTGVRLTCPESVDSCDGKAWNGKACEGIYSVCCNGELCSCCLG